MKVLHIINSLAVGGAETLLMQSANIYQQQGIDIEVLILRDGNTKRVNEFVKQNPKIKVYRIRVKNLYNPFSIFKIFNKVKENYDFIHVHLFPASYWTVLAKTLTRSKVKLFFTEHSTYNKRRNKFIFKILDKWIYKHFVHVIAISDATKVNLLEHLGYKFENKITVVHNGINLDKFNIPLDVQYDYFEQNSKILIQVSSFRPEKDQITLIRSLLFLPKEVKVLLVGDGQLKPSVESLVNELNLTDRVKFLGIRFDIPQLLQYSDIAVLSSKYEGFGLSIVEGMASKKPAIASNIEGVSEIVENYGIVFRKGDAEDLAAKLKPLLNNKMYYDEIALKCYERSKEYDINKMVNRYINLYKNH